MDEIATMLALWFETARVTQDVELYFDESDFTWLVFYSQPVTVYCATTSHSNGTAAFQLFVVPEMMYKHRGEPIIVRIALLNDCTTGSNHFYCGGNKKFSDNDEISSHYYAKILRQHASVYPYNSKLLYNISMKERIQDSDRTIKEEDNIPPLINLENKYCTTDKIQNSNLRWTMDVQDNPNWFYWTHGCSR